MMLFVVLCAGTVSACAGENGVPATAGGAATVAASQSATAPPPWVADPGGPSLFDHVTDHARALAGEPYRAPDADLAGSVAALTYGQHRGIRFREEATIWRDEALFRLQLFHPGAGSDTPVRVHLIEEGVDRVVEFEVARFAYGDELADVELDVPPGAGHAGFRLLYPLNRRDHLDEVVSFLGASYFRLLGPGHVYGLSTRGIAVDIGLPTDEEFPDFTDFWVVRPDASATSLVFFALLDGPSLTGAYRFELSPGGPLTEVRESAPSPTVLAVDARLFARHDIAKLGVAPLTSMYLHGTFRPGGEDDFRPRVHDSEGLLMHTSRGEWIWRPLTNRVGARVTSLRDRDPEGFGLVQRSRDFGAYMDLETQYHRRPSEWIAVEGTWGAGGVELLEIPTQSEFNDNIAAYWVPDEPLRAGEERTYRYRLVTFDERLETDVLPDGKVLEGQRLASVVRTRIGWDALPGQSSPPPRAHRRVVVDFAGAGLPELPASADVAAVVSTSAGEISDVQVQSIPGGGRRATFALDATGEPGADIRLFLQHADSAVSETWSYLWEPRP